MFQYVGSSLELVSFFEKSGGTEVPTTTLLRTTKEVYRETQGRKKTAQAAKQTEQAKQEAKEASGNIKRDKKKD
jgi:hypothetical protein